MLWHDLCAANGHTVLPATKYEPYLPVLPSCSHTLAGTRCAYPRRDGQAELTWAADVVVVSNRGLV